MDKIKNFINNLDFMQFVQIELILTFTGIILVILAIIFGPFVFIWALNALIPTLGIVFTWKTWFAALLILMMINGK